MKSFRIRSRSPPKQRNRPSLVVLAPESGPTAFERRKYNPNDFPAQKAAAVFQEMMARQGAGHSDDSDDEFAVGERGVGIGFDGADGQFGDGDGSGQYGGPGSPGYGGAGAQGYGSPGSQGYGSPGYGSASGSPRRGNGEGDSDYDDSDEDEFGRAGSAGGAGGRGGKGGRYDDEGSDTYSVFVDDANFEERLHRQLDLKDLEQFDKHFANMPSQQRRLLGRMAKLQMVQKKNWMAGINRMLDPDAVEAPEGIWLTLKAMAEAGTTEVDNAFIAGLIASANRVFNMFRRADIGGTTFSVKAAVVGPPCSGKSVFLRSICLKTLSYIMQESRYKSTFVVPLDFKKTPVKSIDDYYTVMTETVVEALLVQRPDLQLFEHSLKKAFATLRDLEKVKRLPKPLSFQDYLRRPMKEVDLVLQRLHQCYQDPRYFEAYVTNLAVLPQTMAAIFGFDTTLMIVDHIDNADIEIRAKGRRPIQLIEFIKFGLVQTQYLISAVDGNALMEKLASLDEESVDLSTSTMSVPIYDTIESQHEGETVVVKFSDFPAQPRVKITSKHCGGCPSLVSKFDQICDMLFEISQLGKGRNGRAKQLEVNKIAEEFLSVILDFEGNPPEVSDVLFAHDLSPSEISSVKYVDAD